MNPFDFDSTLTPLNRGIRDATDNNTVVYRNHGIPPSDIWANTSSPLNSSTAIAVTNPVMASLPLILSGAGPLNANTSKKLGVTTAMEWLRVPLPPRPCSARPR
ncbi:hypothetical protein RHGRI_003487 [Rhododendron griersonianum]|uniref:Uncharacterized protein n=1 Tax=Rhododendron griersonianum TaxID=479676 RepID=A0AAV6L5H6_9ERIC|nr:hypothetical protein RHGRI_003487 [Rhododendron griersonianum]